MMMLGKKPPKIDPRTFKLAHLLPSVLPTAPSAIGWYNRSWSLPMLLNDGLGDCVPAASLHKIQQWTSYASGQQFTPSNAMALQLYEAVGGYVPTDPTNPQTNATDNGCVMLDMLNYMRQTGIAGHKILGFATLNLLDHVQVMQSLLLFGNVDIGIALPISAQGQKTWDVPPGGAVGNGAPGSWGGHDVPIVSAGPVGLKVISWGDIYSMTWAAYDAYVEEAYATFSQDWMESNNASPNRYVRSALDAALAAL
jgi:hypothetical protein